MVNDNCIFGIRITLIKFLYTIFSFIPILFKCALILFFSCAAVVHVLFTWINISESYNMGGKYFLSIKMEKVNIQKYLNKIDSHLLCTLYCLDFRVVISYILHFLDLEK